MNYLDGAKGVIHIGANCGSERSTYARYGLNVAWFEPNPQVFEALKKNIACYQNQKAFEKLLSNKDGEIVTFNISNNGGSSSSILDLAGHKDTWPDIHYTHSIDLVSHTLDTLVESGVINLNDYDTLVIDTQGTELMVLEGAVQSLEMINLIETEAADFEVYKDCCTDTDLCQMLLRHGFSEIRREPFPEKHPDGQYFNIVFRRITSD